MPDHQYEPSDADDRGARTAHATRRTVTGLSAAFMLDAATYVEAATWGYEGLAFYYAGRGGVLGDVDAAEVSAAFHFFPEASIRTGWEQAATVAPPAVTATRFAEVAARWAVAHLPEDGPDYGRLAELAGHVIDAADTSDPATAVFAGWRRLPEPSDPRALVVHRCNALRELRFARHVAAMRPSGLSPLVALMISAPFMAAVFGWPEPRPEPTDEERAAWDLADAATDVAFGHDLDVLDADEHVEFTALAKAVGKAAH